jgi:hypothetical protein
MKVVRLSALRTSHLYPPHPRNYSWYSFLLVLLYTLEIPRGLAWKRTQDSGFNPSSVHVRFTSPSSHIMIIDQGKGIIFLVWRSELRGSSYVGLLQCRIKVTFEFLLQCIRHGSLLHRFLSHLLFCYFCYFAIPKSVAVTEIQFLCTLYVFFRCNLTLFILTMIIDQEMWWWVYLLPLYG